MTKLYTKMQIVFFLFLKKLTDQRFIIFPLPYIFEDISRSINHTEKVDSCTASYQHPRRSASVRMRSSKYSQNLVFSDRANMGD